jgi:diguanylate cyclase (GGDEF)-like protein
MLVLDQVLGDEYGEIYGKAKDHLELPTIERDALQMDHAQVGGILAEQWKLPPLLAVPIAHHHTPDAVKDPTLRKLTELVWIASRCSDVFVDENPAAAIADVRKEMNARHKMSEADCDQLLADIGNRTKEVASLFEINIGSTQDYESILKKANEALIEITLQSQQHASQLQQQNQQLREEVVTDGLTNLANRARFDQFAADAFKAAQESNKPFALLMIDLDKFKKINDTHGHPAGDAVLRYLGRLLKSAARKQDLAARYGGEEMSLCLPNTTRAVAAQIAETIRAALAARPVKHDNAIIPVTASIGVAAFEPPSPITQLSQLIKAADLALYNAKHGGRNCVKVFAIKSPAATTVTPAAA